MVLSPWSRRKLAYWMEHLLNERLLLLGRMPQLQLDRCLCSKWAAPVLTVSCGAGLAAAAVPQCSLALSHHLTLCTRSASKHLSALPCRVTGKLVCVTCSTSIGRWTHQKQPFLEECQGARMGCALATSQLGRCWGWQMCWVKELFAAREGRRCPVDCGWQLIPLSRNPWLLSDGGLSVPSPLIYLSTCY